MTEFNASNSSPPQNSAGQNQNSAGQNHPHGVETDVTHVRQARRGRHAFAVLTASTVLALAAVFGVLAIRGGDLHRADTQPTSQISDQANSTPPARALPAGNPQ